MGVFLSKYFMGKFILEMQKRILIIYNKEITDKKIKFQDDSINEGIHEFIKGLLSKHRKKRINSFIKLKMRIFLKNSILKDY